MTRPAAQPEQNSKVGDWVKWAVGITWLAFAALLTYVVSVEHRITTQETTLADHKTAASKAELEIKGRLDSQELTNQKIVSVLTDVQTGVAKINGYLEARKSPQN
jgi:uncharacterized protein YoxC